MKQNKRTPLLLSLRDPSVLDPTCSPLLAPEPKIQGFIKTDFRHSMNFRREPTESAFYEDQFIQIVESNFDLFCKQLEKGELGECSIPPLIHFIWLGSPLPEEFKAVIATWRHCHPKWEIKLWTDDDLKTFVWSNGYSTWAFEDAKTGGEKSDIWRYEILYQYGGIYSDLDVICFKSFDDLITSKCTFFAGQESNTLKTENETILNLSNAIIGVSKGHPAMKFCIDNILSQGEAPTKTIMARTGPYLLTRACKEELVSSRKDTVLILPCSYFYPLPHFDDLMHKALTAQEIRTHFVSKESLTVHLWAATWYL